LPTWHGSARAVWCSASRTALDTPAESVANNFAGLFSRWFGAPIVRVCFASPATADASLRAIAAHFGPASEALNEALDRLPTNPGDWSYAQPFFYLGWAPDWKTNALTRTSATPCPPFQGP
jgi:hypothetical protein